ncbi:MAG: hypothetical protein R3C49_27180 [Planctomycetaceae bacterium]
MNIILGLVFFLSLMFLALIFGEQLNLFGIRNVRWATLPFDLLHKAWAMLCEAADRLWCFVFDHFWWVTATASGSVGLILIAVMMVSSLSSEASVVRMDERAIMNAGSVLDTTPVVDTQTVLIRNLVSSAPNDSHLVYQVPSRNNRFLVDDYDSVVQDLPDVRAPVALPARNTVPPLDLEPYRRREPDYSRSSLTVSMEPTGTSIEIEGRRTSDMNFLVTETLQSLRADDWLTRSDLQAMERIRRGSREPLREDSELSVQDLAGQVRVIPGELVSYHNLEIEKSAPTNPGPGDFEIRVRVTNTGRDRVNGIIIRELLPIAWQAKAMEPQGVYRASVATWLVDNLRPNEDRILTLTVASTESGRFESVTEVSATAAVSTASLVSRASEPLPPVEPNPLTERPALRSRLPLGAPEVRLNVEDPPKAVAVGEWVTVWLRVENIGTAPASGVTLRVTLPEGLDHHDLSDTQVDRRVDATLARLDAGERRRVALKVRPVVRGGHFTTTELLLKDVQLDLQHFELLAQERDSRPVQPTPEPSFSGGIPF